METTKGLAGQFSKSGLPVVRNVQAENYGYYLFNCIPLWSGNPEHPNAELYWMFRNAVADNYTEDMLRREIGSDKLKIVDYHSKIYSSGIWSLFLVWRRVIQVEARLVKAE